MPEIPAKETFHWTVLRLTAFLNSTVRDIHVACSGRPPRASLLGLPAELRLRIYDNVIDFEIHSPEIFVPFPDPDKEDRRFKDNSFNLSYVFGKTTIKRRYPDEKLPPPSWLSLQSTCRTIYLELRAHIQRPEERQVDDAAHTYAISILAKCGRLESLHFTSIPCPLKHCRVLQARITYREYGMMRRFWGDGGPMPVVRELYQTLNLFLHCGPKFDVARPLPQPLKLEKLVVVTCIEKDENRGRSEEHRAFWREQMLGEIEGLVCTLERTGLLQGLVERVCLCADEGEGKEPKLLEEILVRDLGEEGKVPDYWKGYGFQWGFETYSKLGSGR